MTLCKTNFSFLDFNEKFEKAYHLMEFTKKNIFITGRAGTGKSTLLNFFRENTKKNVVILAPTGVSAVNVRGQTIHSFFNFKIDITMDKAGKIKPANTELYKNLDTIVIDEISMARADLIDCINVFLKKYGPKIGQPFGGVQMIFIGDLYQLPPVVTNKEKEIFSHLYKSPYFFDAFVFQEHFESFSFDMKTRKLLKDRTSFEIEFVELDKIYRQKEANFVSLLNAIRNNTVTDEQLQLLNKRFIPDFDETKCNGYIYLTSTNDLADNINRAKLDGLKGNIYSFDGYVKGNFPATDLPTTLKLDLKVGAQIMLLNNDPEGRWINGTVGKVVGFENEGDETAIIVELDTGKEVDVKPFTWEMFQFHFDKKEKKILTESVGSYTQFPLKLAWAITIHKSQGKTFDRVIIDVGKGMFSHGQIYVALSRCTSFEGIILKKAIQKRHILMDKRVVNFITQYQYKCSEKDCPIEEKIKIINSAIENKQNIEIVYLKNTDEKSKRIIKPIFVGEMNYNNKKFVGLKAYCEKRQEERHFRLDRILEIKFLE